MVDSIIPSPDESQVWIDFDGTITQQDVLDELIRQYAADDSWKAVELEWQQGLIGSRDCLSRQLAAVQIDEEQIDHFLQSIQLDPGLFALIELLDHYQVPVAVLSDGLDRFIEPLLSRAGLTKLKFQCNRIDQIGNRLSLQCPFASESCLSAAAHCKCKSMASLVVGNRKGVYIGDGRSDLCPSRQVSCRFAKGVLAANLVKEGLQFLPYSTLSEVTGILSTAWG